MLTRKSLCRYFGILMLLASAALPALAQKDSLANRLPPETLLVFDWHGTASLAAVNKTNPALRFWADPVFATAREQWLHQAYANIKPDVSGKKLSFDEFSQFLSLLENRFVAGVIGENFLAPSGPKNPHGYFLAFDTSGKQDIVQKLAAQAAAGSKATLESTLSIGAVKVEKYTQGKETYFQAMVGSLFVRSDSLDVIGLLVPRLTSEQPPATSLAQTATYQEAQSLVPAETLAEFFVRVPDLHKLQIPPNPKFDFIAFANAIHLEQLHSFGMNLSFSPDTTRIHGAILGNTAPGGLFDLFGGDSAAFATLALAPAGVTYNGEKMNFLAFYQVLHKGLLAGLPASQAANFAQFDSAASLALGMSLEDALRLFTGEFAQIHELLSSDPTTSLYAVTVRDQEKTLNLLRHTLASMLSTEDSEGDATFLEIAVPYADPKTGMKRRRFYAIAVTSNLMLIGPRKSALREALARSAASGAASSARLMDDPGFLRTRAVLPQKLTGLSYADLSHADWNKIVGDWVQQAEDAAKRSGKPVDPSIEAFKGIAPSFLSKYLHLVFSASWKEPKGIYFDAYMQ